MENYDFMTEYKTLYNAYKRSKKGQSYKKASGRFSARAAEGINILRYKLKSGSYEVGKYNEFIVHRPKERVIKACQFQDKVVQHALCDAVLTPKLNDIFIADSYGSQKDKGTGLARQRLRYHMHEMYKLYGENVYMLKCDVKKYFYSIRHEPLIDAIEYYLTDTQIIELCQKFIDSTPDPGIALGNQINQILANLNLDSMDKFIIYELGAGHYGRYMDDFYIMSNDRKYLKWCKECISEFLETLSLRLNEKTEITNISHGMQWLGFNYKMIRGEVIARKLNSKRRETIKKYKKMTKLLVQGKITFESFANSFEAWANHLWNENCVGLIRQMEKIIIEEMLKGR